ncbi:hypothetical protein J1614_004962 [Plenodomus biglobosus]|nr:hypothetical protein J1614_004962 [Plenodomus biglobosus]
MSSDFDYDTLDAKRQQIRTLTLHRGTGPDPITCVLNTVSLLDHPTYVALSYVWGDARDHLPINVNGSVFSAIRNLALALQYIRDTGEDVVLWVDAVCINQDDIDERNSQVQLMGILYAEAERVLIWLGEADETTDELVDMLESDDTPITPGPDIEDFIAAHTVYAVELCRRLILFDIIALRPWWQRVWTVQECVLPRNDPVFRCGLQTFSWERFFEVFYASFLKAQAGFNSFEHERHEHIQELRKRKNQLSSGLSEHEILQKIQAVSLLGNVRKHYNAPSGIPIAVCVAPCLERQASVPHDYIYGFLGLVASEEKRQVTVDYRLPHWTVYRDFFELLLNLAGPDELKLLAMLSFYHTNDSDCKSNDRPSWLPDFSSQNDVVRHTGMYLASELPFGELEEVWWSDDNEILMLRGVHIDIITATHDLQDTTYNWANHILEMADKVPRSPPASSATPSTSSLPASLVNASHSTHISTLFLGSIKPQTNVDATDAQLQLCWNTMDAHRLANVPMRNLDNTAFKQSRSDLGGLSILTLSGRIVAQTYIVCGGRKLATTSAGIAGICVPDARPGDHVVCLFGFHMPFLLRPFHGHFRIVGGVHLKGLMEWGALSECMERGELCEATYRIR